MAGEMDRHKLRGQALQNASKELAQSINCLNEKRLEAMPVAPKLAKFLAVQISRLKMALKEIEKARLLENSRQGMPSSALAAFERMEEQHQRMESLSQKAAELTGIDMETQFAMLESGDRADDELRRMKEELLGTAHHQTQAQLDGVPSTVKPVVDDELERLKKKLDDL